MDELDLDYALDRSPCPACGIGRVRPTDISNGTHLDLKCPTPQCRWRGRSILPSLQKKLIYLDTAIVSKIAKSLHREETESPWVSLYETLREATALDVISCPMSPIDRAEAELSTWSNGIVNIARKLGSVRLNSELRIQKFQLFRSLDRYSAGEEPSVETSPPSEDAFKKSPHEWLPVFSIFIDSGAHEEMIDYRRATKTTLLANYEQIYQSYAADGNDFESIRKKESFGYGRGILKAGYDSPIQANRTSSTRDCNRLRCIINSSSTHDFFVSLP